MENNAGKYFRCAATRKLRIDPTNTKASQCKFKWRLILRLQRNAIMIAHLLTRGDAMKLMIRRAFCVAVVACVMSTSASKIHAQPAPAPKPVTSALSAEEKSKTERMMVWAARQQLIETPISLKVSDGTVTDIVAQIEKVLPQSAPIEVRDVAKVRLSFETKGKPLGEVLQALAALSQCEFSLLPERILLAPRKSLSKEESKARLSNLSAGSQVSSQRGKVLRYIADSLLRGAQEHGVSTLPFRSFSTDHQRLIHFMAAQADPAPRLIPASALTDAQITLGTNSLGAFEMVVNLPSQRKQLRVAIGESAAPLAEDGVPPRVKTPINPR
jgi:hypothetical protein